MMGRVIELAGLALGANQLRQSLHRRLVSTVYQLLAAVIALAGIGFLLSALWIALSAAYGSLFASLWIGLALMGLAILVLLVGLLVNRRPPSQAFDPAQLSSATKDLMAGLDIDFKKKGTPTNTLVATLAAGYVIGQLLRR